MGILDRFTTIIKANINDLLDKAEDPAKMIDQYLLDMIESLAEVKKETAGVMAEETRTKRLVDENAGYADQVDALNAQLSKLNSRVSTLQDSNAALQQKSAFFDAHVAFVENDGTDYYHNYSCSYFKKQSYWAYSVNLAIARGYTACPYCGG